MNFLPDWVNGLYEIVSATLRFFYDIFAKLWHVIVFLCSMLAAFFQEAVAVLEWCLAQAAVILGFFDSAAASASAAIAAGWPPQLWGIVAWMNHYAPVAEMAVMVCVLLFVYAVCSLIRVIKSFVPTVS